MLRHIERLSLATRNPMFCVLWIVFFELIHNLPRMGPNLWLMEHSPELLLTLSPANENAIFASANMGIIIFMAIMLPRRLVPKLFYWLIVSCGVDRLRSHENRMSRWFVKRVDSGVTMRDEHGWKSKLFHVLPLIHPNKVVIMAHASVGTPPRRLAFLVVVSTIGELILLYTLGSAFAAHIDERISVLYVIVVTVIILTALWHFAVRRLRRHRRNLSVASPL